MLYPVEDVLGEVATPTASPTPTQVPFAAEQTPRAENENVQGPRDWRR